jgi:hypothetical protein
MMCANCINTVSYCTVDSIFCLIFYRVYTFSTNSYCKILSYTIITFGRVTGRLGIRQAHLLANVTKDHVHGVHCCSTGRLHQLDPFTHKCPVPILGSHKEWLVAIRLLDDALDGLYAQELLEWLRIHGIRQLLFENLEHPLTTSAALHIITLSGMCCERKVQALREKMEKSST